MKPAEIARVMEQYREPAIMLYRAYPPGRMPSVKSHLGGCPSLPPAIDWPRKRDGQPLHFVAQVDCAELPATGEMLPASGMLFFFVDMSEDPARDDGNLACVQDACRVLYTDQAGPQPARPPGELPGIESDYSAFSRRDFDLPNEPTVSVYPHWPLLFQPIQSWPDSSAVFRLDRSCSFDAAVERARVEEAMRALGIGKPVRPRRQPWKLFEPAELLAEGQSAFPQAWIMVERMARRISGAMRQDLAYAASKQRESERRGEPYSPRHDLRLMEQVLDQAIEWVTRATRSGLDDPTDEHQRGQFRQWLTTIYAEKAVFRDAVTRAFSEGLRSALQYAVISPKAAGLFPVRFIEDLAPEHLPVR